MPSVPTTCPKNTALNPESNTVTLNPSNQYGSVVDGNLPIAGIFGGALCELISAGVGEDRDAGCSSNGSVDGGLRRHSALEIRTEQGNEASNLPIFEILRQGETPVSSSDGEVPLPMAGRSTGDVPPESEHGGTSRGSRVRKYEENMPEQIDVKLQFKSKGKSYSPISELPTELVTHVFSFLDPASLLASSLVCRWFNAIATSPHSWRSAFVQYFPTQKLQDSKFLGPDSIIEGPAASANNKRYFSRLLLNSTWRNEYLLRTSLLRTLSRGKAPMRTPLRIWPDTVDKLELIITYPVFGSGSSITHISANFPPVQGIQHPFVAMRPRLLHGSLGDVFVQSSDPTTGRLERRPPLHIPQPPSLLQPINDPSMLPGGAVGTGVMDLSEEFGFIYGETVPRGRVLVNAFTSSSINACSALGLGVFLQEPETRTKYRSSITSVWIAKKRASGSIFETTRGKCGVLYGDSKGAVAMYGLPTSMKDREDGAWTIPEMCWLVSPGVPITAIKVDEEYSARRKRSRDNCFSVVVLNALGEVYCLKNVVDPSHGEWTLVKQSHRQRNTSSGLKISETEVEEARKAVDLDWERLADIWAGWGMNHMLTVDFAEENIIVIKSKEDVMSAAGSPDHSSRIRRYHFDPKLRNVQRVVDETPEDKQHTVSEGALEPFVAMPSVTPSGNGAVGSISSNNSSTIIHQWAAIEEKGEDFWHTTEFTFGNADKFEKFHITAAALDNSNTALLSLEEDPLVQANNGRMSDVPGLRARFFGVGTSTGTIFIWNIREPVQFFVGGTIPKIEPLRVIRTDSPQITTLGISSLYIIHGGSDGVVQCWEPLYSIVTPVRTIHGRFSSRARRRILQAESNNVGLQDNQFAARAVVLDPDPTILRGCVALGTYIRFWSFASDQWKNALNKKKKKGDAKSVRAEAEDFGLTRLRNRKKIDEDINCDRVRELLTKEEKEQEKQKARLKGRFGIDMGADGMTEEEMLAYAKLLSEETWEVEKSKRTLSDEGGSQSGDSFATTETNDYEDSEGTVQVGLGKGDDSLDAGLVEAIRRSLLETNSDDTFNRGISCRYEYEKSGSSTKSSTPVKLTTSENQPSLEAPGKASFQKPVLATSEGEWPLLAEAAQISPPTPPHSSYLVQEREMLRKCEGGANGNMNPPPLGSRSTEVHDFDADFALAIQMSLAEEESRKMVVGNSEEDGAPSANGSWCGNGDNGWNVITKGNRKKGKGKWKPL